LDVAGYGAAALVCAHVAAGEERASVAQVGTFDNAAVDYWRALAYRRPAITERDIEIHRFIERRLPLLPPKIFVYRPEVGQWLIGERAMLQALHEGGLKSFCVFNPDPSQGRAPDLSYQTMLRDLTRRSLAAAKAFEFVESYSATAAIYIDLFRMLDHID
jgi:hypothetical protein